MSPQKNTYPRSWNDIPLWRRREIARDMSWFLKYSPVERLDYVDREWAEIQDFIKKYGFERHGTGKRS
ncbi:MAG: hypothetical protein JXL84_09155 [Deltaproteobacteria bacterium]|nr:hypothetical protein [Deltaproteobacteria bacterium]